MASIIKNFDFYGIEFSSTVAYSSRQQTLLGGSFGIIYILASLFFTINYGKILWEKDRPNVINRIFVNNSNEMNLSMAIGYFPLFKLRRQFHDGLSVKQIKQAEDWISKKFYKIFKLQAFYKNSSNYTKIEQVSCYEMLGGNEEDDKWLKNIPCIKPNIFQLKSTRLDPLSKVFVMGVYLCRNSTKSNKNDNNKNDDDEEDTPCFPKESLDSISRKFEFTIVLIYSEIMFQPENAYHPFSRFKKFRSNKAILSPNILGNNVVIKVQDYISLTDFGLFH